MNFIFFNALAMHTCTLQINSLHFNYNLPESSGFLHLFVNFNVYLIRLLFLALSNVIKFYD